MSKDLCKKRNSKIANRIHLWSQDETSGIRLYFLALIIFLCGETLSTTMFPTPGKVYLICKVLPVLLVGVKILWFDRYTRRGFLIIAAVVLDTVLIIAASGYMEPFLWVMMVIGAKNVPWRKILQIYIVVSLSIVLLAFCASLLNVIENLQYIRDDEFQLVRNSFGAIYTTDFASHIFTLLLASFYLLKEKLKTWHIVAGAVIAALIYLFCLTRLDVGCMLLTLVIFGIINFRKKRKSYRVRYETGSFQKRIVWFMPLAAALMFAASAVYSSGISLFVKLDGIMSGRLALGHKGLVKYGVSLFGQQIDMVGNGGVTEQVKNYFFVDCSYLYVFLRYGLIFLVVVLGIYVMCCKKYRKDPYFLAAIVLVAINCMIAHHLIELAYNPFALALLAKCEPDIMREVRVKV